MNTDALSVGAGALDLYETGEIMFIEKFINIRKRQMVLQCIEYNTVTGDFYIERRVSSRFQELLGFLIRKPKCEAERQDLIPGRVLGT